MSKTSEDKKGTEVSSSVYVGNSIRHREIAKAREAYQDGDIELSRVLHDQKAAAPHGAEEHHGDSGKYIKSMILGGIDGVITTFAIVSSTTGSSLDRRVVLLLGVANLVADGLSMGLSDYVSSQSENEYVKHERKREEWEIDNYLEGEKQEMIDLYYEKGMTKEDAESIINTMAKYKEIFLDTMLREELGLIPPDEDDNPMKNGLVTFGSFMLFGIIPLFSYIVIPNIDGVDLPFIIATVLTGVTLIFLGFLKASLSGENKIKSSFYMLATGTLAAGAGYLIGFALSKLLDVEHC